MRPYFLIFILFILTGCVNNLEGPFFVERVIDGDTLQLESGTRIRFSGINTPEISQEQCYAKEAKDFLSQIEGEMVYLEKDELDKDKYGRSLRYVYSGEINLNFLLVEKGYAKAYDKFSSSTKYFDKIKQIEDKAKIEQRGLWACNTEKNEQAKIETKPWFNFYKIILLGFLFGIYILWNIMWS